MQGIQDHQHIGYSQMPINNMPMQGMQTQNQIPMPIQQQDMNGPVQQVYQIRQMPIQMPIQNMPQYQLQMQYQQQQPQQPLQLQQQQEIQQQTFQPNKQDESINYYQESCKLYLANVLLTSQLKELIQEKNELLNKIAILEKKGNCSPDNVQSSYQQFEERKRRHRRAANEIERHYRCPDQKCQKSYGSEGSLQQHIKLKHPEINLKDLCIKDLIQPAADMQTGELDQDSSKIKEEQQLERKQQNEDDKLEKYDLSKSEINEDQFQKRNQSKNQDYESNSISIAAQQRDNQQKNEQNNLLKDENDKIIQKNEEQLIDSPNQILNTQKLDNFQQKEDLEIKQSQLIEKNNIQQEKKQLIGENQ